MGDREVLVRLRADISQYQRALAQAAAETQAFGRSADGLRGPLGNVERQSSSTGKEIDRLSGRVRLAADAFLILGGAMGPLGAGAVGGIVALSAQLGALAGGLGVTILATKGLGDALKSVDAYQLEPTAANLAKMNQELEKAGPSGAAFVQFLDSIEPDLKSLQMAARDGLLPGAEEGIDALLDRLPELRSLIGAIGSEMGDLASDAGGALGGDRFDSFFNYLKTDGIQILDDTGRTIGALTETVGNLFAAFGGMSTSFSGGLLSFTEGLAEASANLETNAGFIKFVDYIQTEGPHALETLGSLANMFLQVVEATAPLGGPVLTVLGKLADVIAAIADSDLGSPIFAALAAMALLNRSMAVSASLSTATFGGPAVARMRGYVVGLGQVTSAQDRARMSATQMADAEVAAAGASKSRIANIGKGAAVIGGLTLATSDYAQSTGLSNTASMALMGTIAGPWGAAIGAGVGLTMDFAAANDGLTDSLAAVDAAAKSGDMDAYAASLENARTELEKMQLGADHASPIPGVDGFKEAAKLWGKVRGETGEAEERLKAAEKAYEDALQAQDNLADGVPTLIAPLSGVRKGLQEVSEAAQEQETAIRGAIDAMHSMREEALRAANAELNYQASIDDARKALKENGKTHDKTTEKGRANLSALYNLAGAWNAQSEVIKGNSKQLATARKHFVDTAVDMGYTEGAARKLSRELFDIPEARQTKISTPGMDEATSKAKTLKQILDSLKSKDITIALHYQRLGNKPGAPLPGDSNSEPGGHPRTSGGKASTSSNSAYDIRHGGLDALHARGEAPDDDEPNEDKAGGHGKPHKHRRAPVVLVSEAGSDIIKGAHGIAQALKMLQNALAKSEKSLDKERQARDDAQARYDAFSSTVGGAYSTIDPFAAAQGSVWGAAGNPLAMFDSAVAGNTANTTAAQSALGTASGNGLDGPLYEALAQSGNLALLQAFAGLSSAQIDQRELQFAAQSNAQSALGAGAAAAAGLTAQVAISNKNLIDIRQEVRELRRDVKTADSNNQKAQDKNAKDVKDGVNGAAHAGHGRGR